MKKTLKLKKIGTASVALTAGVALMLSAGAAAIRPSKAFAEVTPPTAAEEISVFEGIAIDDKCEYGQTFTVPAVDGTKVTVTAPNGTVTVDSEVDDATDNAYNVAADQVGNYTVKYEKGGAAYEFSVLVTLEEDYFLWVDANGADIPTYAKVGGEIRLPVAAVKFYDENKILKDYLGNDKPEIKVYVSQDPDKAYTPEPVDADHPNTDNNTVKNLKAGKLYVTYSAKVGGATGLKYFTREFVVNVQSKVDDTSAPTLSVAGVSNDISVNRPVTLPTATATDNFDDNVKITIKVTDPNGDPVKMTEVDKYGYAYRKADTEYADVVFDNDKAMTFYPMLPAGMTEGTFVVTYSAVDDAGNASSERQYYMTAKDLAAPVFQNESDYTYMIPETWGMTVKKAGEKKGESVVAEGKGGKITFPVLEVVDNRDHAYPTSDDDNNLISLYFRITDADKSKTILEFSNILDTSEAGTGRKFTANDVYTVDAEFDKDDGFTFQFDKYLRDTAKDGNVDYSGTYTVYYRARDKAQNTSSKTYTITMQNEFTDDSAPSTAEVTVPDYVSAKEGETMIIPSPAVADANDSRPHTVYRVYSDNGLEAKDGGLYIEVKGGEEAEFIKDGDKRYLVIDEGTDYAGKEYKKKLELGTTLYFYVSAEDKVGNVKYNTEDNTNDYTKSEAVTKIVSETSGEFSYAGDIKFGAEVEEDDVTVLSADIKEGDNVNAGGFTVTTEADMRDYTGFEVAVRNEKGEPVTITLDTFSRLEEISETKKAVIYVKNIKFTAPTAGDYTMTVRVFDVNGMSSVYGYAFTVEANESVGPGTSSAVISEKGNVNVKYQLHNKTMPGVGEVGRTYHVARQIEGSVFSVMGSEFTAKNQGTFYFRDGYIDSDKIADYTDYNTDVTPYGANADKSYYIVVTDNSTPTMEVQGVMPRYQLKSTADTKYKVELPAVTAYTENGMAEVDVTVKNKSGNDVKVEEEDGKKFFYGETDGEHTVTYTATYRNATPVTKTYTVYIGDIIGPDFNVIGGTSGRLTKGDEFKFGKIELIAGEDGKIESGVTITKRLVDPSGADVSGATVSGSYSSYSNSENNGSTITLDMSGRYQVIYTATDSVGNVTTYPTIEITVVSDGSSKPTTITTLSTVLIIIAVVLLAGVIVYVVRFRKVKEKK
ncbi:MAG: hypothetical protein J1G04_05065 [Clostridiales bacterium]|nr:hypothetical protein [Clostridiales bacterium]